MLTRKLHVKLAAATALVSAVVMVAGCSRPPEQQLLTQFFRAAKARDNATTSMMSAVTIDPREVTPRIVREENYASGRG